MSSPRHAEEMLMSQHATKAEIQKTLRKARNEKKRERQLQTRHVDKSSELVAAVFVLTSGDAQVHRKFCNQENIDAYHSFAALSKYFAEISEDKLEQLFESWSRGGSKVARAARKFVEETSLIAWIDSMNSEVGFAPQFGTIVAQRREISKAHSLVDTPVYANKTTERQWARRFVRNHRLTRGRITRQSNGSRAQLLEQVCSSSARPIFGVHCFSFAVPFLSPKNGPDFEPTCTCL